ncbi:MAG: gliding motility-associated C-terminal domain-containing protein [Saprospiraceae bacterium]|nr:gliding motility-associated C-terminal domain-containing protein [Saprospiraceae bacterium]
MKNELTQNWRNKTLRFLSTVVFLGCAQLALADFAMNTWLLLSSINGLYCAPTNPLQYSHHCDVELNIEVFDATCTGAADGSIVMSILTGTPPYTIDWDNDGAGDNDDPISLFQLAPGTYSVTVVDDDGCTGFGSFDVYEPDAFNLDGTIQPLASPNANNAGIDLTVTGGTLPYSFDWDNDGVGDNDDPEDLTTLGAGTYTVMVTDVNGCTATAAYPIEVPGCNILLGAALASTTCAGSSDGKINLSVQGGTAPFTYDWNNDGIGDNDDQEDLHDLAPGTYTVTVTDEFGCTASKSFQINQPSEIFINASIGNATSIGGNDGWIDLTVTGSTPPYVYDWNNDGIGDNDDPQDLAGLTAGNYSVKVTDSRSCTKSADFTVAQPAVFDLALRKTLATGQSSTVAPGGFVTFTITVFNQGGISASNILVIDYLPNHLSFMSANNTGWTNFGAGPTWFIQSLPAGASISKNIKLKVNANAPLINIKNFAEITAADDNDSNTADPPVDIDSRPNAFQFDDPGGQPNGPADDVITGNGTGAPGTNNPLTDEDDHDGAIFEVNVPSVTLGNLVFRDLNNDGIFNNQDYGQQGVAVELYDVGPDFAAGTMDDVLKDTKTTNAQGEYLFKGLLDGYYFLKLTGVGIPPGLISSTGDGVFDMDGAGAFEPAIGADFNLDNQDDGTQTGVEIISGVIHLTLGGEPAGNGDANYTLDFGLYEPQNLASIGDFVWQDLDFDGQQGPQEIGVQGVAVRLYDLGTNGSIGGGDDSHLDTEFTNASGYYSFTNVLPGDYYLVFEANTFPLNFMPTQSNTGNDTSDSDANGQGQTGVISLIAGEVETSIDFGLVPLFASIGNFVWQDTLYNGIQDPGEPGAMGVSVSLYDVGNNGQIGGGDDVFVGNELTDINGFYQFDGLAPGSYFLVFDTNTLPNGYLPTTQNIGGDLTDSDADAMGKTGLIVLGAGQTNTSVDFGMYVPAYDLSLDKSLAAGQPITVDINDLITYDIAVTNQGTAPVFNIEVVDNIPNGLRFVQANNSGWVLAAPNAANYIIPGPINPGETAIIQIKLAVQYGASGQSMQNIAEIIGAKDSQGVEIADLDSTPENGNPDEDDLSGTAIELIPHDPTGWIYCDKTGRIITGGTISVTGPNGIPNSQVNIIHNGSNGYYEFYTDGTPGVYTMSYTHPDGYPLSVDCAAQPSPVDITGMPDPYILGVDTASAGQLSDFNCASNPFYLTFSIEPGDPVVYHNNLPLACTVISGTVTMDGNFNDQIDPADTTLGGITVYLFDCADLMMPISSTTTNSSGQYIFSALSPGDYMVRVAPFPGFRFVSTGVIDQFGYSACMVLNWGDSNTLQHFGLYPCPTMNAGADISHCYSASSSQLDANLSHGTGNFTWTPADGLSNPNIENPIASPDASTMYIINFDDGFGCTATDEIEIQVGSSVPYMTNAPYTNLAVQCPPLPSETPIFADFCDISLTVDSDTIITPLACGYIRQITWTATNDEGNSISFVQILTLEDTQAPTMAASHPFFGPILHGDTLVADCSLIPSLDSLSFSTFDNCSVPPTVTFSEVKVFGNCPVDGYLELRNCGWTSTDACGNTASLNFVVIVTDNFDPVLSPAPADLTVSCGAIPAPATLTATDNCDTSLVVVFDEVETFDVNGCISQIVRTWEVEDDCGNHDFATQTINVNDNTPPTLVGVPDNATLACGAPIPAAPIVTATDACDSNVPVTMSQTVNGNPAIGCFSLTRTWTATDDCGNTATTSQTINLLDNTPPTLVGVPADQNYDCSTPVPAAPAVTATDFCDANVSVSFNESFGGNTGTGCYTITRTWSASDDCGNGVSATQLITIFDNTPPALVGVPANLTLDCSAAVPAATVVTATDFCDATVPVSFVESTTGVPGAACRVITRRWTATDDCGNTATASQTITVQDNQSPVLSQTPANIAYTCVSEVPTAPTITATDYCDNVVPVLYFQAPLGNPAGCNFQLRRIWAASDDCGNSVVWTQTITVNDDEPPVFTSAIPANTVVNCDMPLPAAPSITASDNCDTDVSVTLAESYFGDPASGCYILTRTWTATDNCGNNAIASQDIVVRDLTPPNFVGLPNNSVADCDNIPGNIVTATDNCDATPTVTFSDQVLSSTLGCVTQVVRTWVASDDCGNTRIASRTFTVQNTDVPIITIVEPLLLGVQDGDVLYLECDDLPSLTSASAVASADCCGAATVTFHETVNAGNCASDGYYAVMQCGWIASDCCGNRDSLFFTVYVIDNTPPSLVGVPADLVLPVGSVLPPPASVSANDNCDHSLAINYTSSTSGPASNQTTVRTWSVTDDCGNSIFEQQTILITNDNLAPIISNVPSDVTIEGPIGGNTGGVNDVIVNDNVDNDPTLTYSEIRTGGTCCYVLTRSWTATDDFGNTSVAEQQINVVDTQAPVISGFVQNVMGACSLGNVPMPQLSVTDNCTDNLALQFRADTIYLNCGQQVTRTWTATDECGNTASVEQVILKEDAEAPVFTGDSELLMEFFASQNALPTGGTNLQIGQTFKSYEQWSIGNQTMPSLANIAVDNCTASDEVRFKVTNILSVNNGCEALWTFSFAVLDACGNVADEPFTVTAIFADDKAPVFDIRPDDFTANCGSIPTPIAMTANDETSGVQLSFLETLGIGNGSNCPSAIVRTWTATDACGNQAVAQQIINVKDNQPPVLANIPASIFAACGNVPLVPTNITATDACAGQVPVIFSEVTNGGPDDCTYFIIRTWRATDNCGNSTIKQQHIWVADNTPPAIAASLPLELTVSCDLPVPPAQALTVSDNCDDSPTVELVETILPGDNNCQYSLLRKWTVTDQCGNRSFVQQTVRIVDSTLPSLANMPANLTVTCGNVPAAALVTANDNCDADVAVVFNEVTLPGCPSQILRTWTAIDDCGNEKAATQTITVVDNQGPILYPVPTDAVVNCGDRLPSPVNMTAFDLCNNNNSLVMAETITPTPCGEDIVRTWTATDGCGNTSSLSQLISVVDTKAPAVNEPIDLVVGCGQLPTATTPLFTDDCDNNLSIAFSETKTPTACGEEVLRTWTATDDCGNSKTIDQVIRVIDAVAPALVFANPALAGLTDGDTLVLTCANELIFDKSDVVATDNCSTAPVELEMNSFSYGNCATNGYLAAAKFQWTGTDACGNIGLLTLNVKLVDDDAPLLGQLPTLTADCGEAAPDFTAPEVLGDCSEVTMSFASQTLPTAYGQDLVGTWTATDACGNAATAMQTIQVYNIGAAQLVGVPADQTVNLSAGETVPVAAPVAAVDNCSGEPLPINFDERSIAIDGCHSVIERVWSVVGLNGVTVNATQLITVTDQVQFSTTMTADSCDTGNGGVALSPIAHSYSWSNALGTSIGSGAVQNNLNAGVYNVVATNANGCSVQADVVVAAVCNCQAATIKKVGSKLVDCGEENGKVVITLEQVIGEYEFTWSPDLGVPSISGHARTKLPAGHYEVKIAYREVPDCITTVSLDVVDDCNDCPPIFGPLETMLEAPPGPRDVCLPVPYPQSAAYQIKVDGSPYTGTLAACHPQSVKAYYYGGIVPAPSYSVVWQQNGQTFYTWVKTMGELAAAMAQENPQGRWFVDNTAQQLVSLSPNGNYGLLTIRSNHTGSNQQLLPISTNSNAGTLLHLQSGKHAVTYTNPVTGCSEEINLLLPEGDETNKVVVNMPKASWPIAVNGLMTPNGDGQNDYLLVQGIEDIGNYELRVFNALGQLVFRTKHYDNNWGGSWSQNNIPGGTYFYLLEDGKGGRYSGHIQILR